MKDWVTGEEVTYQYDSLNRLISAVTTGPEWGLSFQYDGFGNLTNQTLTKGSAPTLAVAVDPATNRILGSGFTYDANGNITATSTQTFGYDVANRAVRIGSIRHRYDPSNRQVYGPGWVGGSLTDCLKVYGPSGELLGDFAMWEADPEYGIEPYLEWSEYVYFAGHRIKVEYEGNTSVNVNDRLGSARAAEGQRSSYYPYGETRTGTAPVFATYPRNTATNLHYAMNRWYSSQIGRFTTPDPYRASASLANPQSWSRYAYVENDPVNKNDPSGLDPSMPIETPFVEPPSLPPFITWSLLVVPPHYFLGHYGPSVHGLTIHSPWAGRSGTALDGLTNAGQAASRLENKTSWSEKCKQTLAAAGIAPRDVDNGLMLDAVSQVQAAASAVEFVDGTTSGALVQSLYAGRPELERAVNPSQTVAQALAASPATNAMATLLSSTVYIRPSSFSYYGSGWIMATVLHELLHNITGLTDPDLQRNLGLSDSGGSVNITLRLAADCLM